jgi:hypothetical protein
MEDRMSSLPGFTADASLYRTRGQYRADGTTASQGAAIVPQMAVGLSGGELEWCRAACLYCRYYGYYCWPCYICALIISVGW